MASDSVASLLASSRRGLVKAPAGCGKTHLISEATALCTDRQLILTHTHAGVRAILDHLRQRRVSANRYRVTTLDGWALMYATAFPTVSGWQGTTVAPDAWPEVRSAAIQALKHRAVRRVVCSSYGGVIVDEYQDCCTRQNDLAALLAELLPCRILGDPLQAVFWVLNRDDHVNWSDVESTFPLLAEPATAYRWLHTNPALGSWLMGVRHKLIAGEQIDLRNSAVDWSSFVDQRTQLQKCRERGKNKAESVVALRQNRNQCRFLAKNLNNQYSSIETVECEDLLKWAERIDHANGTERANVVLQFADKFLARFPPAVVKMGERMQAGNKLNPRKADRACVAESLIEVAQSNDPLAVDRCLAAIESLEEHPVFASREIWKDMRRTLQAHRENAESLRETAWGIRDKGRRVGRRVPKRCLGTVWLVKGLEFDHAIVLNAAELDNAESLYVALSRGSWSLTVLSEQPIIRRSPPRFKAGT